MCTIIKINEITVPKIYNLISSMVQWWNMKWWMTNVQQCFVVNTMNVALVSKQTFMHE